MGKPDGASGAVSMTPSCVELAVIRDEFESRLPYWRKEMKRRTAENRKRIEVIKLQEAADAVIYVLEEHDKHFQGESIKKSIVCDRVPDAIEKMRHKANGCIEIPAVENIEVKVANHSFVLRHWTDICLMCAEYGYYIVWNQGSLGVRLGSLEEYIAQQPMLLGVTDGFAKYHNRRTKCIEEAGERGADLQVRVVRHQEENSEPIRKEILSGS